MPYWDWAAAPPAGDKYFPTVVGQPLIQIITPTSNNKPVQINNPLYSYKFNPLNPLKGDFPSAPVWTIILKLRNIITDIDISRNHDGQPLFGIQPVEVQPPNLKSNRSLTLWNHNLIRTKVMFTWSWETPIISSLMPLAITNGHQTMLREHMVVSKMCTTVFIVKLVGMDRWAILIMQHLIHCSGCITRKYILFCREYWNLPDIDIHQQCRSSICHLASIKPQQLCNQQAFRRWNIFHPKW